MQTKENTDFLWQKPWQLLSAKANFKGCLLLFSNPFSRKCLFSVISVVGTQNDWIPELANKGFIDNICPVTVTASLDEQLFI